jgi:NADPH:quinone reductase-like Zn-dependent oxidoreductase
MKIFRDPVAHEGEMLVNVRAASIKNIDKLIAKGAHYANHGELPCVVGVDGVGVLADGRRVYTGGSRKPYGMMAEKTVVSKRWMIPIPDALDDVTAAAIPNPALSSWIPLVYRAQLQQGETVLVMGATGVSGKLAIQIAKLLGAGRVIAAGRNETVLKTLFQYGADATIALNQSQDALIDAFLEEKARNHFDIVLDFLWGPPTEALLAALTGHSLEGTSPRTRLIQIGEMAGSTINLRAEAIRSSSVEIYGSGGGNLPADALGSLFPELLKRTVSGELRIDTEPVPLSDVENAWQRQDSEGRRVVVVP